MKDKLTHIIQKPFFLFLLPVFFVLHGYTENYDLVPAKDAFLLAMQYCAIALGLSLLSWLLYRDFFKANLLGFCLLCIQFFFGSIHDLLKKTFPGLFFTTYSFILPAVFITILIIIYLLKRRKKPLRQLTLYLNSLLLILILLDGVLLFLKTITQKNTPVVKIDSAIICDTCKKPDIYLIIADGYPGKVELKDLLNYDNTPFENELRKRGFHITDSSTSNYNFTTYSMASMLNMNYLEGIAGSNSKKNDIAVCHNTLKNSYVLQFLSGQGYDFYNYSIFDFTNNPSLANPTFLLRKTKLITSQTFLYKLRSELGFHLATTLKIDFVVKNLKMFDLKNNTKLYSLTSQLTAKTGSSPKFVYTHLMMPHHPYYYDSAGNAVSYKMLTDEYWTNKEAFKNYLIYSNRKFLDLIDTILSSSKKPPVIILMGDHGFRDFKELVDKKYHFMNLNAVLLPDSNYAGFYKGMSNINQFRVILNSQFGQQLPLLKDSTSFLNE